MQGTQRRKANPGFAKHQAGAMHRIELPARDQTYTAGRQIDMGDAAITATLKLDATHPLPIKRMPAIMDNNICPNVGRMAARWRAGGSTVRRHCCRDRCGHPR
jgi:hypothetical protein